MEQMITNVTTEKTDDVTYKLNITVSDEFFQEGMNRSYIKNVKKLNIPGFRRGKAPRRTIEKLYGESIFYEDCFEYICPRCFEAACQQSKLDVVGQGDFDVVNLKKDEPFVFSAIAYVKPEFQVEGYKNLEIERIVYPVTDADIDGELEKMREHSASFQTLDFGDALKLHDTATIDFEGFVDGEAFEGGKGENFELVLGKGQFIPGFEQQLVDKKVGDHVDVEVKFPDDYQAEDLAGKQAVFQVKIKAGTAKNLPDLDDEFAMDVSEFDTLDELRESVREKLVATFQEKALTEMEDSIISKICDSTSFIIPDCLVVKRSNDLLREFATDLQRQGLTVDLYCQLANQTVDEIKSRYSNIAHQHVKASLVLSQIAEIENVEATTDEIEAEYIAIADAHNVTVDDAKKMATKHGVDIEQNVKIRKTIDLLVKENTK